MGLNRPSTRTLQLEVLDGEIFEEITVMEDGERYLIFPNGGRARITSDPKARGFGLGDILSIDLQSLQPIAETLGWSIVANGLYDAIKDGARRIRSGGNSYPVTPEGIEKAISETDPG